MSHSISDKKLKIAMLAGEASGDILGAGLISEIKARYPNAEFFGVGGERMLAEGFVSWYPMDRLAVMGLIEPLKRLFELLEMRKSIRQRLLADPPDVFIGIDSPDFNLDLELSLREGGIKVAHYVSPSVWAWRQGRIKKIARAVDLMLTLFPFEEAFYLKHKVPVACVGHTLADSIPLSIDPVQAREALLVKTGINLDFTNKKVIGMLPGSRASEVRLHTHLFLSAARLLKREYPDCCFLIPAANEKRYQEIKSYLKEFTDLPVQLVLKHSQEVMAASDALLIASGTTALEAMLLKRPMVISYRMSGLAFWILSRMVKVKHVGLPNLLAGRDLVPERLQTEATPENLKAALANLLNADNTDLLAQFDDLHQHLRRDANKRAALAVLQLIEKQSGELV